MSSHERAKKLVGATSLVVALAAALVSIDARDGWRAGSKGAHAESGGDDGELDSDLQGVRSVFDVPAGRKAGEAPSAFDDAAASVVDQLRAYREAVLSGDLDTAAAALGAATGRSIGVQDIEQINGILGIGPEDTELTAEDIASKIRQLEPAAGAR